MAGLLSNIRNRKYLWIGVIFIVIAHCQGLTQKEAYSNLGFKVWEDPSLDEIEKNYKTRVQQISEMSTEEESMVQFKTMRDSYNLIKSHRQHEKGVKQKKGTGKKEEATINISIKESTFVKFGTTVVCLILFLVAMAIPVLREITLIMAAYKFYQLYQEDKAVVAVSEEALEL